MATTVADLEITASADTGSAEAGLDGLNSKLKSTAGETAIASAGLGVFSKALTDIAFVGPIQAAMDFEAALTDAYIAVGDYSGGIQGLQTDIMDLAEALPFSAGEVASLIEELGRLGVASESIKDVAYNVMALAAGLGTDLVPTGQAVIKIINSLGLSMDSVGEISDSLFRILAAGTLDLGSFMSGWEKIGSLVKTAGMSFIDAAGFLTILTDAGVDAATAGTALAMLFGKLISPTEELKSMLSSLGIAFQDASGQMLPVTDIILNIMDAWKSLTQQEKIDLAKMIGGEDQFKYLITLFDQGREAFNSFKEKYESAMGLPDVIAAKMGTAKAAWDTFKETLGNLQIIVGQKLLPAFKSIISVITEFVGAIQSIPSGVMTIGLVIAGAVAAFAALAGVVGAASLAGGTFMATIGLLTSPITLTVAALVLLAAGLVYAYTQFEPFRSVVNDAVGVLMSVGSAIMGVVQYVASLDAVRGAAIGAAAGIAAIATAMLAVKAWAGLQSIIQGLAVAFRVLGAAMMSMNPIMLAIVAIAAILGAAYATNFLGFADAVNSALKVLEKFAKFLGKEIVKGAKELGNALKPVASLVGGALASGFNKVLPIIIAVGSALLSLASSGIAKVVSWFQTAVSIVGTVANGFMIVLNAVISFVSGLYSFLSAAGVVSAAITFMIGAINSLITYYSQLWAAVMTVVNAFQGGGLLGALQALPSAFMQVVSAVMQLVTSLLSGLLGALGSIDWGMLLAKGQELLQGLLNGIINKWPEIQTWLGEIGSKALSAVGDLLSWLVDKGKQLLAGLWQGIVEYAPQVWEWLKGIGSLALNAVGDLLSWLIPKGKELLAGLWQGIVEYAPQVWAWLKTIGSLALVAVGNLIEWLIPKGKELLAGLWQGIVEYAPQVWSWLSTLGSLALSAIGSLIEWLIPKGKELLAGLWQGIVEYAPQVWTWLGTLGSLAVSAVGDLLSYLLDKGKQLIAGLWQGAVSYWPSVTSWLAGLPSAALSAIGDMLGILYDKGADLIQGMWDGAKAKYTEFENWIKSLNPFGDNKQSDASARWNDHQPWGGNPVGEGYRGPTQGIGNIQNIGGGGGNYDATGINAATAALNAYSPAASVASAASAAFGAALSAASSFATSLSSTVSAVGATLTGLATGFIATGTLIGSAVTSWATYLTTFSSAVASNSSAVGASLTALATGFIMTGTLIASALNTAKSNVTNFVSSASSSFSQFGSALNTASSNVNSFRSAVSSAMSGVVSAVSSGMSSASNAVRSGSSQWPSIIAATGGSMAAAGFSAGAQAGAGVASGLYSMLGAVAAAAAAIAAQVEIALAAKLKIASPSKVTTYMGEMVGAGLVKGMNASLGDVARASVGLATASIPQTGMGVVGSSSLAGSTTNTNNQNVYNVTIDARDLKEYESAIAFFQDLSSSQAIM
ncbi:MAG: phage tail tape measure protein [Thermomicrobiales bacterium]